MTLWFRLLWLLICQPFRRRLVFPEPSVLRFRVWPSDIDLNLHMNNAKYLSWMDLGRTDILLRSGLFRPMLREKLQAVLGGATVRYRRSLNPFQPVRLETRIVGWDCKWFYIGQKFITAEGSVAASAMVRGLFTGPGGRIDPAKVLAHIGHQDPSPDLPDWITSWEAIDGGLARAWKKTDT